MPDFLSSIRRADSRIDLLGRRAAARLTCRAIRDEPPEGGRQNLMAGVLTTSSRMDRGRGGPYSFRWVDVVVAPKGRAKADKAPGPEQGPGPGCRSVGLRSTQR